jgi:hypothetical protein
VDLSADYAWITLPAIEGITLVTIPSITPADYAWISLGRLVTPRRRVLPGGIGHEPDFVGRENGGHSSNLVTLHYAEIAER